MGSEVKLARDDNTGIRIETDQLRKIKQAMNLAKSEA